MFSLFSTEKKERQTNRDVEMAGKDTTETVADASDEEKLRLNPEIRKQIAFWKLQRAAMKGNWESARMIFEKYSDAKTAALTAQGMTALQVAASCGRSNFVEKLVELLSTEDLEWVDQVGRTALHHVALAAGVGAAKAMVQKNLDLPNIGDMEGRSPLLYAAQWGHPAKSKEMLQYLYGVTKDEPPCQVFTGDFATELILSITASGSHDIALRLLKKYPDLALKKDADGTSVLHVLARQPSAFDEPKPSVWKRALGRWMLTETKQNRPTSIKIVKFVCKELSNKKDPLDILDFFLPPADRKHTAVLQEATVNGVYRLVKVCLNYFPDIIWYTASNNRLLLHDAIEHRQVDIFNYLIRLMGENTKAYADAAVDLEKDNNTLHLAAQSSSSPQLLSVPDPAFQMQRELQWYTAVEQLVYDEKKVAKNKDGDTPRKVFFKSHEDLLKSAKDWMKNTSDSCMVVAALVTTVAFAAMITVPGGNDSGTGIPILSRQKLFVVFSIANAVSMISSTLSLLMFLSVQTSRETEKDFLESLPNTLLKGLICLFIGVATMMIAFGTAIGLSLQKRVNWAYIPVTVLACCPALMFTKLQFPLFKKTLQFTPGPGKYQRKTPSKLCSWLKKRQASLIFYEKGFLK